MHFPAARPCFAFRIRMQIAACDPCRLPWMQPLSLGRSQTLKSGGGTDIAVVEVIGRFWKKSVANLNKTPTRRVHLVGNDNAVARQVLRSGHVQAFDDGFHGRVDGRRRMSVLNDNDNDKAYRGARILKFRAAATPRDQRFFHPAKPLAVRSIGRREIYPRHPDGVGRIATCECGRPRR
jgi:hypothetical protein